MRRPIKNIYRLIRSVIVASVSLVVGIYLILYVLLALPYVQNRLCRFAEKELSSFFNGNIEIGSLKISPFSEIVVNDFRASSHAGPRCLQVTRIGAGIDIFKLIFDRKIDISYAELSGLDASVVELDTTGHTNIDFIIEALKPKDKNKPPTHFSLTLRRVTVRGSKLEFNRSYIPNSGVSRFDANHVRLTGLNLDATLPILSDSTITADLKRLSFTLQPGLQVSNLKCQVSFTQHSLDVKDFVLTTPGSRLPLSDLHIEYSEPSKLAESLKTAPHRITIKDASLTPSEFSLFYPQLAGLTTPWQLNIDAEGDFGYVGVNEFMLDNEATSSYVSFAGSLSEPSAPKLMKGDIKELTFSFSPQLIEQAIAFAGVKGQGLTKILHNSGRVKGELTGNINLEDKRYSGKGDISTDCGEVDIDAQYAGKLICEVSSSRFDVGRLLDIKDVGEVSFNVNTDIKFGGKIPDGEIILDIPELELRSGLMKDIYAHVISENHDAHLTLECADEKASFCLLADAKECEEGVSADFDLNVADFNPSKFGILPQYPDYTLHTELSGKFTGDNLKTLLGELTLRDMTFQNLEGEGVDLNYFRLRAAAPRPGTRYISLISDWAEGWLSVRSEHDTEKPGSRGATFDYRAVADAVAELLNQTFPIASIPVRGVPDHTMSADLSLTLKAEASVYEFFKLPLVPLWEGRLTAFFNSSEGVAEMSLDVPYILQGKNTLIERTQLSAVLNREAGTCGLTAFTHYPAKKGDIDLDVELLARNGAIYADIGFNRNRSAVISGNLSLSALLNRNVTDGKLEANVNLLPSTLMIKDLPWKVERGSFKWQDGMAVVNNFLVHRENQFLSIDGVASAKAEDTINVSLAGIDLDYVFSILNINYVTFGGMATGEIEGRGVLGPDPDLATKTLFVKGLTYNGALLGDAAMKSRFDTSQQMVGISADISENGRRVALLDGGIWVKRDSLSFSVDADRLRVGFMQPFVSAFSTDLKGRASGQAKLFGTFSDIDLTGRLKADSISMRLLSTNVVYQGSDSVLIDPGTIRIPHFRLYDRNGHAAILSGELHHRYFHDPVFDFRLNDASELLCYDISRTMNPDWFGTIYGSGNGHLTGRPGIVNIDIDMTTTAGSTFTFVLSDRESAVDYNFLQFTDKRKSRERTLVIDSVPDFLRRFHKQQQIEQQSETDVVLDVRATVTPQALVTLVMDPEGGDKITCRGGGPLQMTYSSASNDLRMYGKYSLEEGVYNFTLQDIILKDFTIRQGSSIAFNGDPLNAELDITANYRVNTNLTDLDQSFANDRELNRTNVPVDAVLKVSGEMTSPDIAFDVELPTLSSEVERKVKSLISTDDMMSRQIIYLLALSRFYTPEYNASSAVGGSEMTSLASTTLSSQLSNMLSRMTDRVMLAPSIRSDKGDFSDMEVDLALSSRLLDNRLLINGNFGYRDRGETTQSTQFIGDFDIEYLLNKNGNLRLKAYNRFNDQNYYLRQALTTQGVGIVVRKDFNNLFSWLRPLRHLKKTPADSLPKQQATTAKKDTMRKDTDDFMMINSASDKKYVED